MALQEITFTARIMVDENDDINGEHLCEEIQSYLNSAYHYDEEDKIVKAKVIGYKIDNITPFLARSEY